MVVEQETGTRPAIIPWAARIARTGAVVLREDCVDPDGEGALEFRLTYAGKLLSSRDDKTRRDRSVHIHEIRREFHKQLRSLWQQHPALKARFDRWAMIGELDQQFLRTTALCGCRCSRLTIFWRAG